MFRLLVFLSILLICIKSSAQTGTIYGKILSNTKPVANADIWIPKTTIQANTDSSGNFSIQHIPAGKYALLVAAIGFEPMNKTIVVTDNQTLSLLIELKPLANNYNEVVVTGVTKAASLKENPLSVVTVNNKQLDKLSEPNVIDMLVKKVPGLSAVKTGPNISKPFIRGLGYNRVLTLYDGVRQEGQQWGDEHGIEIDAYQIHKAEVIKGPASLMFGSDALAGVLSFFSFIPDKKDGNWHGKYTSEFQSNNSLVGNSIRLDYSKKGFVFAVQASFRAAKNYQNAIDKQVYLTNFNEQHLAVLAGYEKEKSKTYFNITLFNNHQGIPDGSRDSLTRRLPDRFMKVIKTVLPTDR